MAVDVIAAARAPNEDSMAVGRAGQGEPSGRSSVVIAANSFWNIVNFRTGLVRALVAQGYHVVVVAPEADREWAAANGAEAIEIAVDRSGLNPFRDALLILNYIRLFRRVRPNFFLGYTAKPNIYGTIAAKLCRIQALPNISGLGTAFINPGPLSALVGMLYRVALRDCPIVFFQNPDDYDLFVARGIVTQRQVRLLPGSGVDLCHFMPAQPSSGVRFLFVGRLLGDKGVREFVEAARMLRAEHPSWRFQLLGSLDDDNRTAIEHIHLEQWVNEGVVEHLGSVEDVRPFIAASTAVVLPSYREGLPRSLLEAAAMARPLIATDVPGNRHIVQDGINGLLCAVCDASALAKAMEKLGEMPDDERLALGRAGRVLVENEFGEDHVIQAYLDALTQLHASRKG